MNLVFVLLVALAFIFAAGREIFWSGTGTRPMEALGQGIFQAAETSVTLAIGLVGMLALFLGLMKILEAAGLLVALARLMRPLMVRLFPDVPPGHPAMGAMVLNLSANMLGLGNAATPLGIRAMQELERLNPHPGTATNAMVLFLAINTANVTLLPTSVIALRTIVGSAEPAGIIATTLAATIVSTAVAIAVARIGARVWPAPAGTGVPVVESVPGDDPPFDAKAAPEWATWLTLGLVLALVPIMLVWGRTLSPWIIPALIAATLTYGYCRNVPVYEVFVDGAKDGFTTAVRIIPYLVAILVAIGMFRASGALEMILGPLGRLTGPLGLPSEALTLAAMRSLSGSGSFGLLADFLKDPAIGPDSYTGYLVSTLYGSSETTFYVIAVYFGAVGIRNIRHTLAAGLIADLACALAAVGACALLFL
jgi:spore maturation protein SpmA/spore maturation protein SpmB